MSDHERIEELLAVRALGGLEPDEATELQRALERHGPDCAECARLERGFGEAAAELAAELEPVPVRDGLEDELLARLDDVVPIGAARAGERARAGRGTSVWRRVSLVAAAAALVLAGWVLRDLTLVEGPAGPPAGFLAQSRILPFEGTAQGRLALAYRPGLPGAYLVGDGLAAPGEGRVYELWVFQGEVPVSAGCFAPDAGSVVLELDAAVDQADALAVTVEPSACPKTPTTTPILQADPTAV